MKDANFWRIILFYLLTKHLIRVSPAEGYNWDTTPKAY